jgi:hypothetical protein
LRCSAEAAGTTALAAAAPMSSAVGGIGVSPSNASGAGPSTGGGTSSPGVPVNVREWGVDSAFGNTLGLTPAEMLLCDIQGDVVHSFVDKNPGRSLACVCAHVRVHGNVCVFVSCCMSTKPVCEFTYSHTRLACTCVHVCRCAACVCVCWFPECASIRAYTCAYETCALARVTLGCSNVAVVGVLMHAHQSKYICHDEEVCAAFVQRVYATEKHAFV